MSTGFISMEAHDNSLALRQETETATVLSSLRATRHAVADVRELPDAVQLVRRSNALDKLLDQALKTHKTKVHEQFEIKQDAAELYIRTQRRAGELLMQHAKNRGGRPATASRMEEVSARPPTLTELGIDAHESHRWQRLARIPIDQLEELFAQMRSDEKEITTAAALKLAQHLQAVQLARVTNRATDSGACTARGEFLQAGVSIRNITQLDPRALVADLRPSERQKVREELTQLQRWATEVLAVLK